MTDTAEESEVLRENPRFDVVFKDGAAGLEYHFCREWDDGVGCYGTNPDHGMDFEEAKAEVASFYEGRARWWRELTLEKWK